MKEPDNQVIIFRTEDEKYPSRLPFTK